MDTASASAATNGYNVYLIYQKEVYNCDHSFLQSMMDWLYSSVDSPYKFRFRNKAFININHQGIQIQKDNLLASLTLSGETGGGPRELSNWKSINFNLKHLKEIYVDKRHKDTCVLVSKVSSSSSTPPTNNYVWKASNPSNYQSFRSPYSLNSAYKKSYLLTIIKFKEGPSRLLQSIQSLDNILADYNKKDLNKNQHVQKAMNVKQSSNENEMSTSLDATSNVDRPSMQQYFSDYFSKQVQEQHRTLPNYFGNSQSSNSASFIYNSGGHNSLKSKQVLTNSGTPNSFSYHHQRRLSVDSSQPPQHIASLTSLHFMNNSSNLSLDNYGQTHQNGISINRSGTISRQSSSNDVRPLYAHLGGVGAGAVGNGGHRFFMQNNSASTFVNLNNNSLSQFYSDQMHQHNFLNHPQYHQYLHGHHHHHHPHYATLSKSSASSVPASPTPAHHQKFSKSNWLNGFANVARTHSRSSSKSSQINNGSVISTTPVTNHHRNDVNTSNENLSEIGYQQYKKKLSARIRSSGVPLATSTSSLKSAEKFYSTSNHNNKTPKGNSNLNLHQTNAFNTQANIMNSNQSTNGSNQLTIVKGSFNKKQDSSASSLPITHKNQNDTSCLSIRNHRLNQNMLHYPIYQNSPTQQKTNDKQLTNQDDELNWARKTKNRNDTLKTDIDIESKIESVQNKSGNVDDKSSSNLNKSNVYKIRNKYESNLNGEENNNTGKLTNQTTADPTEKKNNTDPLRKISSNHTQVKIQALNEENLETKSEKNKQKFKYQINLMGSLNHKENKFLTSSIKKSLNSAIYEKKSHDTIVSSRKKLASLKLNESLSSPSYISSSSSINSCASSYSESGQKSKNKNKFSSKEKSIHYDSNDKTSKKVLVEMTNDKNKIADIDATERLANKTVFDKIKKFTHSSSAIENPLTHPSLPRLSSDFNSKLNRFINTNTLTKSSITSNTSVTTRVESNERRKGKSSITINNKLADFQNDSNNFQDEKSQTSHACDEIKIESNKVKDIIKSFNNIEKRTSTNLNPVNGNNDLNNIKQNVSQTPKSTNHKDIGESPIPFAKLDKQLDAQNLNSKFITKNLNKTTLNGNFSQNGKEIGTGNDQYKDSTKTFQALKRNFDLTTNNKTLIENTSIKPNNEKLMQASMSEYNSLKSLKLQLNVSYSNSTNNLDSYEARLVSKETRSKDTKPSAPIKSPSSTSSESSKSPSPQLSSKQHLNDSPDPLDSVQNKKYLYSPHLRNKLHAHLKTITNESKNVENTHSSSKSNTFLSVDMLKSSNSVDQSTNKTKAELIDEINTTSERIKMLTNSFVSTLKSLDTTKTEKKDSFKSDSSLNSLKTTQQPPTSPQPLRKRTFANMVWPMDAEEERILRSSSPYIVPEIIVQRNEGVKSILKKSSNSNAASPSLNMNADSNSSSPTSNMTNGNLINHTPNGLSLNGSFGKKRVDFGENFLFFNFFDTYTDDEKSDKNQTPSNSNTICNTIKINSNLNLTTVN